MSSRLHGSEETLARLALVGKERQRVLVGGLGMGFTLRAALDCLGPEAEVVVDEIVPELIEWNRGVLAELAGHPLNDARVTARAQDVAVSFREAAAWDAILLDVDNGPDAFSRPGNNSLYSSNGLTRIHQALRPGGVLAVWSLVPNEGFETRLKRTGFVFEAQRVPARGQGGRKRHVIYLASHNPSGVPEPPQTKTVSRKKPPTQAEILAQLQGKRPRR